MENSNFRDAKWLPALVLFLHSVGEFEDLTGDGQDDVDEVGALVALEVDATAGGLVGWDGGGR